MSNAGLSFQSGIKDAEELLRRFDEEKKSNVLGLDSEVLKRAALIMVLAAWETYVKDRFNEEFNACFGCLKGSEAGRVLMKRKDEDLKRFFNPNSERTGHLFATYFDVDITRQWSWMNYKSAEARKTLDSLIAKRGDAAHRAKTSRTPNESHLIKREELEKAIRFIKGLVDTCEKIRIPK